jgi:uncharacterized repeat protein (TIGR01451 family)
LTAVIDAQDIQSPGNNNVTVFNSAPGGGTSIPVTFTTYLALPSNDLIYDPSRKLLWAAVPSSAGSLLGNAVVSIDPYTGLLGTPIWVGSEPNKLAISGDGTTLWVGFIGTPSAREINLTSGTPTSAQPYFPGGWGGNIYATSLAVLPGTPSSVAIATGFVSIYDGGTARSQTSTAGATYLAFGPSASTLYGYTGYSSDSLAIFSIDSTGITSSTTPPSSNSDSADLRYDNGRLYLTSGGVLDSTSGALLGTFAASGPVASDSSLGRAFILNDSGPFGVADQITVFNESTFNPIGSFSVEGLPSSGFNNPSSLVRWGSDGLAFRTTSQIYVLRSTLVQDLSSSPADIMTSISAPPASTTGTNTTITITVKNNGPSAASGVTLADNFSPSVVFVSVNSSQGSCGGIPAVQCNLGSLGSGSSATVTLTVLPTLSGSLTNTATAGADQPDPNTVNNTANSSTAVTGSAFSPTPILSSLAPQSAFSGASTLTLTVNGTNFTSASTAEWNGAALPTVFVNSGQLTATVDASLLATLGFADVTVNTANPGGGVSGSLPFSIFQTVALDANDLIFDPFTRKLYASVPSTALQVTGNSIVSIDPLTGAIGAPVLIGSEPTRLSLSDDGQYLYVVLSGSNSVRRMDLTTLTPGTQFTTVSPLFGPFTASDLAVMPGNSSAIATVGYSDGIQVWDVTSSGATARALTQGLSNDVYEGSVLAWADSAHLYSNDEGLSPSSFHRFTVGPSSFAEVDSTYLDAVDGKITYSGGLVFTDGGGVVDPSPLPPVTPKLVARFMGPLGASAADTTINRVFFLSGGSPSSTADLIAAYDASRFTLAGTNELDGLAGDALDLVRWGTDGLAFRTTVDFWGNGAGRIVVLHGSSVLPRSSTPNPVPFLSAASPSSVTAPAGNTWLTIMGSSFVPGSVVDWNGSPRTTVFVSPGQLRVAIPAADLASPQTVSLQVVNPSPGGGPSSPLTFTIH